MDRRARDARRAHARGPRRRRGAPSLRAVGPAFPGLVERFARPGDHVAHRVHRVARSVAVIAAGFLEIVRERRRLFAAAHVLALYDAIVLTTRDPALQLARAHRGERMRAEHGVDELPHLVPWPGHCLVFGRLSQKGVEIDWIVECRAARELEMHT